MPRLLLVVMGLILLVAAAILVSWNPVDSPALAGFTGKGILKLSVRTIREGVFDSSDREVLMWDGSRDSTLAIALPAGTYAVVTDQTRCFATGEVQIAQGKVTDDVFGPITGVGEARLSRCHPSP